MIPPCLTKWDDISSLEGMLFFAQRFCELLYDKTLDTYKVAALNVNTSAIELRTLASRYLQGKIVDKSTMFSVEEVKDRISRDLVFTSCERERLLKYVKQAKEDIKDKEKFYKTCCVLCAEVSIGYYEKLKQKLVESVQDVKQKRMIDLLASSLAVELQTIGYKKKYIFSKAKKFFLAQKFCRQGSLHVV